MGKSISAESHRRRSSFRSRSSSSIPVAIAPAPLYLRVPPGHERNWGKHCRKYDACGRPVYFVQDDWYNNVYSKQYRNDREHHRDDRDSRRDDRRDARRDDRDDRDAGHPGRGMAKAAATTERRLN